MMFEAMHGHFTAPIGTPIPVRLLAALRGPGARMGLTIHRNNMWSSLLDALAAAHPVTCALTGEAFFRECGRRWLAGHFPTSPSLNDFGHGFADFLAAFRPAAAIPYLADVARLEHRRLVAYHAAEAMPSHAGPVPCVDASGEVVTSGGETLHPSAGLLESAHDVHAIWLAHVTGEIEHGVDLRPGRQWLLVLRPHADVHVHAIQQAEHCFMQGLARGERFATALRGVAAQFPGHDWATSITQLRLRGAFVPCVDDEVEGIGDDAHARMPQRPGARS